MKKLINKLKDYKRTRPNRFKAVFLGVLAFALIIILALITQPGPPPTTSVTEKPAPTAPISITASGFDPATVTVRKGTIITWTNEDTNIHQIYANPYPSGNSLPGLKSEILNNKQRYTYTADRVGSFGYHDQLNPAINGTLHVKD